MTYLPPHSCDARIPSQEAAVSAPPQDGGTNSYAARADSLTESVERMRGRAGVTKLRHMLTEARHTQLAAELQGRG